MSNPDYSTITDFLLADHRRLDELWVECAGAIRDRKIETVRVRVPEFVSGLRRHIRMEEDVLFPAFEERSGIRGAGPTAVMRAEHKEIEAILERLSTFAKAGDRSTATQTLESQAVDPSTLLRSHNVKEENVLYPMIDRMLSEEERKQLLLKMQSL